MMTAPDHPLRSGQGRLALSVPATLEGVDRAVQAARDFYAADEAPPRLFALLTALREAVLNAASHGAGLDPGLAVECEFGRHGPDAVVTVRDPGDGFDWRARKPQIPPSGETCGRGRKMMDIFSKSLTYNAKGNEVTFTVALDHEDHA